MRITTPKYIGIRSIRQIYFVWETTRLMLLNIIKKFIIQATYHLVVLSPYFLPLLFHIYTKKCPNILQGQKKAVPLQPLS